MEVKITIRRNKRRSLELINLAPRLADEGVGMAAEEMHSDIDGSWSSSSPSSPGEPPAVVTTALKNSGKHSRRKLGEWQVVYGGPGAEHAGPLEFGSTKMAARPFFRPAIFRLRQRLPKIIKAKFEGAI